MSRRLLKFSLVAMVLSFSLVPLLLNLVIFSNDTTMTTSLFVIFICGCCVSIYIPKLVDSYDTKLMENQTHAANKQQALNYINEWQEVSRQLAHDIKNPLTPIEMTISNLHRNYPMQDHEEFAELLQNARKIVTEEVFKLKGMANQFSTLSKLPNPSFERVLFPEFLKEYIEKQDYASQILNFKFDFSSTTENTHVLLDKALITRCLDHILENIVDFNSNKNSIRVSLKLDIDNTQEIKLIIFNEGQPIPASQREKIFMMRYSTKSAPNNFGMGLSVVKKIILQHEGNVACIEVEKGAAFQITLPINKEQKTNTIVVESMR